MDDTAPAGHARRHWGRALAITAVVLAASMATLGSHFFPSTEAVRVRNAFLFSGELPASFDWRPPTVPDGYLQQLGSPPEVFVAAAGAAAAAESPLVRMTSMVNRLNPGRRLGNPIQRSTVQTYQTIATTRAGYCSDYSQVLNGLAWAAGIPVREWGMSFDGFGGDGHAFNEIFDAGRGKWIMIDGFYGFWVRDAQSGEPLSALEFRDRLRLPDPLATLELVRLKPPPASFRDERWMIGYYQRGVDQFYLWWGNNVFDYDEQPMVRVAASVSRGAEQLAAMLVGIHPQIRIPGTPSNSGMVAALEQTRERVTLLAVACCLLLVMLLAEWRMWRRPGPKET